MTNVYLVPISEEELSLLEAIGPTLLHLGELLESEKFKQRADGCFSLSTRIRRTLPVRFVERKESAA